MSAEGQPEKVNEAETYFKKALEAIGDSDKRRNSYLLGSLGNIYLNQNKLELAWENFEKHTVQTGVLESHFRYIFA